MTHANVSGENNPMFGTKRPGVGNYFRHKSGNFKGENNPMFGKHHSEETLEKIRQSKVGLSEETRERMSNSAIGKKLTSETIEKIVASHLGTHHSTLTKLKMSQTRLSLLRNGLILPDTASKHFHSGFREDLKHFVRSSWEANICRIFNFENIKYEYESSKCRFDLGDSVYICDFYLPDLNIFVEVKGRMTDRAKVKYRKVLNKYPSNTFNAIDGEVYYSLMNKYRPLILNLE
jgi:hypothetical protein